MGKETRLHGLMECPDCDVEMDVVDADEEKPLQYLEQACPTSGCSFESRQIVMWYPDNRYVLIAPAIDGDVCGESGCTETADVRLQDTNTQITRCRCEGHLRAHEWTAWTIPKRVDS